MRIKIVSSKFASSTFRFLCIWLSGSFGVRFPCVISKVSWSTHNKTHYANWFTILEVNDYGLYRSNVLQIVIWCDFDRASSLICGNKMPTRCNRGFYCRSYCLLNMFAAPLCPSSGAQEYYTVVAACGISCCGFQVDGLLWSWRLCVRFAGCCRYLMMGIVVPETCWASNKICNKNLCCI